MWGAVVGGSMHTRPCSEEAEWGTCGQGGINLGLLFEYQLSRTAYENWDIWSP